MRTRNPSFASSVYEFRMTRPLRDGLAAGFGWHLFAAEYQYFDTEPQAQE